MESEDEDEDENDRLEDLANAHSYQQALDEQIDDEKRRLQRRALNDPRDPRFKKNVRLKGMDPIHDAAKRRRKKRDGEDSDEERSQEEESSEEEENQTFM